MNSNFYSEGFDSILKFGMFFLLLFVAFFMVILVIYIIGKWRLYEKAGQEGWKSIIPFYNDWVYVEMAGLNSWYFLAVIATTVSSILDINDGINMGTGTFNLISLVGVFFCNYNICKKLHKDTLFAVLMTIFPFIVVPIVGLSNNINWDDSVLVSSNGPIDDITNKNNDSNNNTYKDEVNKDAKNDDSSQNHRFCSNCGSKIETGSKYCSNCGKEI